MGGFGAFQLGCRAPDTFDAIISVAGYGMGTNSKDAPQPYSGTLVILKKKNYAKSGNRNEIESLENGGITGKNGDVLKKLHVLDDFEDFEDFLKIAIRNKMAWQKDKVDIPSI